MNATVHVAPSASTLVALKLLPPPSRLLHKRNKTYRRPAALSHPQNSSYLSHVALPPALRYVLRLVPLVNYTFKDQNS